MKEILFWTWCLPQTLVGLVVKWIFKAKQYWVVTGDGRYYFPYASSYHSGSISLGKYVIISKGSRNDIRTIKHEYGHQIQSFILGPLYLLVIGLPSLIWCWIIHPLTNKSYYWFYTEKWADKLGGVDAS